MKGAGFVPSCVFASAKGQDKSPSHQKPRTGAAAQAPRGHPEPGCPLLADGGEGSAVRFFAFPPFLFFGIRVFANGVRDPPFAGRRTLHAVREGCGFRSFLCLRISEKSKTRPQPSKAADWGARNSTTKPAPPTLFSALRVPPTVYPDEGRVIPNPAARLWQTAVRDLLFAFSLPAFSAARRVPHSSRCL